MESSKVKLEYIWLDGYTPEPTLRSKTKIVDSDPKALHNCPMWSFDGSSTEQAEGNSSDCLLRPVAMIPDPQRFDAYLVMCEVLNSDETPHKSNTRHLVKDDKDLWLGFEQEYVFTVNGRPLGFPEDPNEFPVPQGPYYCGVGEGRVTARDVVEEHLDACLTAGLSITGINAEVMLGQWEYQIFAKGALEASDAAWFSRYLLHRTAEEAGLVVELHPKPVTGDWNGSGMHTNFSTERMREKGGDELFGKIFDAFEKNHEKHIAEYGSNNDMRLTGKHETQAIDTFSYGVADRGASLRIPPATHKDGKGYLEDRRPSSNADPYRVVKVMQETLSEAGV